MCDFENMDKRLIVFGYLFRIANRLQSKMDSQMKDLTAKQWFVKLVDKGFVTIYNDEHIFVNCLCKWHVY